MIKHSDNRYDSSALGGVSPVGDVMTVPVQRGAMHESVAACHTECGGEA